HPLLGRLAGACPPPPPSRFPRLSGLFWRVHRLTSRVVATPPCHVSPPEQVLDLLQKPLALRHHLDALCLRKVPQDLFLLDAEFLGDLDLHDNHQVPAPPVPKVRQSLAANPEHRPVLRPPRHLQGVRAFQRGIPYLRPAG